MITSRKNNGKRDELFIFNAIKRTSAFLFIFYFAMFLLYIVGNYQQFLDSNLLFIIRTSAFSSLLDVFFCLFGFILSIICICMKSEKKRYVIFSVVYFLMIVLGIFFLLVLTLFDILSGGL